MTKKIKKSAFLIIRLTQFEKDDLLAEAGRAKLTLSEYVRAQLHRLLNLVK
jgi:hypothetical protein